MHLPIHRIWRESVLSGLSGNLFCWGLRCWRWVTNSLSMSRQALPHIVLKRGIWSTSWGLIKEGSGFLSFFGAGCRSRCLSFDQIYEGARLPSDQLKGMKP